MPNVSVLECTSGACILPGSGVKILHTFNKSTNVQIVCCSVQHITIERPEALYFVKTFKNRNGLQTIKNSLIFDPLKRGCLVDTLQQTGSTEIKAEIIPNGNIFHTPDLDNTSVGKYNYQVRVPAFTPRADYFTIFL
jgi:hypothetical protein